MEEHTNPQVFSMALDMTIRNNQTTIDKFQEEFSNNPKYALEWGDKVYSAVAFDTCVQDIKRWIEYAQSIEEKETPLTVDEIMGYMDKDFIRYIRDGSRLSSSTSASHRMMETALGEVASHWFDRDRLGTHVVNRVNVEKVLKNILEPVDPA